MGSEQLTINAELESTSSVSSKLEQAPDEIKLAVDLIYLLESNEVDPKTALAALDIVMQDLKLKLTA